MELINQTDIVSSQHIVSAGNLKEEQQFFPIFMYVS